MICGSGRSKSRLAKAAGAEPSGQMRDEKVHAVVAWSTFPSQNVQSTPCSDHFWKLRCRKKCTPLWCEANFEVKMYKTHHIKPLLEVEMSKKCTPLWCEDMKSKCTKHHMFAPLLEVQMSFGVAGARDCAPLQKWAKREGFVAFPKTMAGMGHLKRICKDAFRVAGAVHMFMRDVRRSGRWFPERGCILEHQICRFAKMILRHRCSTSYDLASIFRGRRSTLDRWSGKIRKRIGTRPSALHSTFHFWRKSHRIVLFLMLSSSKIEEVSQNCFVLDVVKFKNWGKSRRIASFWMLSTLKMKSLAALLRFWRCQVQTLRKCRRLASFLMWSTLKKRSLAE